MKVIIIVLAFATIIASCKKDEFHTSQIASVTVVNAINDGANVKVGSNRKIVYNNDYAQIALNAGENNLYVWPEGDSSNPYFTQAKLTVNDREIYSLFLGGMPTAVEGLLIKEDIPYHTDSTIGIRFINLSSSGSPFSINLASSPMVNEVSDIGQGEHTDFKSYSGNFNSEYTFEIRDANTAYPLPPLATYSFSNGTDLPRFANVTLVISKDGTNIIRVNHDRP